MAAVAVTIFSPGPAGAVLTLNGTSLPEIDGSSGPSFPSIVADFESRNVLEGHFGMDRFWRYEIDLAPGLGSGLLLFVFTGVALLMDPDTGNVLDTIQGTFAG